MASELAVFRWLDETRGDLSYAARSLARSRSFTIAAILTLSVGIGATTAIYSIVDTILLQPLPFPDSDRLVRVIENYWNPGLKRVTPREISHQEFLEWRSRVKTLTDAAVVIAMAQRMVRTPDGAAGLWGAMVSSNTFTALRSQAFIGRTIVAADDDGPDVVVLSFDTWRRHFHSDPAVVGTAIEFRTGALLTPIPPRLLTVLGVMPPDFQLPTGRLDFFTPILLDPSKPSPRGTMMARMAPGVPQAAVLDEINAIGASMRPPWPTDAPPLMVPRFEVHGLKDQTVRPLQPALRVLLAAVIVVLLVVCANVANLLLVHGTARQREVAVRLAVGASRTRIVRHVLAECALLAVAGGLLGALLGAAGVTLVRQLATVDATGIFKLMFGTTILPRGHEVQVDLKVLGIAFGIAAATSVIFGMLPALRLSRTNHLQAMRSRGSGTGRGESRLRGALVVAQLALATSLLVAAGLLSHSFFKLSAVNKGYDAANVLDVQLLFPDQYTTAKKAETIATLLARFRSLPGVRSAGFSRHGVLIGEELTLGTFVPPGRTLDEMRAENIRPRVRSVSDGYLTAMGVPLFAGRELAPSDDATAPVAIVINRSAAQRYFPNGAASGQVMEWHLGKAAAQVEVVGVVDNILQRSLDEAAYPEIYVDYRQLMMQMERSSELIPRQNEWAIGFLSFAVRTPGNPVADIPAVREVVREVDPNIGIDSIVPMNHLVAASMARERFSAVLSGVFAAVAGLLAAIGIYGVLAYSVAQRTHEMGIRMALGAERAHLLSLVMMKGLTLAGVGIVLGVIGAAAGTRYLQSMLFGITALDRWTFLVVAVSFSVVAALAAYLPARRATKVDPMVALRVE